MQKTKKAENETAKKKGKRKESTESKRKDGGKENDEEKESENQENINESGKKKIVKAQQNRTIGDALENLVSKLPNFLSHVFLKREQASYFQYKLLSVGEKSAVVQVNFSENFTLKDQGEIQSAYWDQEQLTLFTISIWTKSIQSSIAIVSDDLDHDKTAVLVFMNRLLQRVKDEFNVNVVDVFSDGASSQFKNQYIFHSLIYCRTKFNLKNLNWHFFCNITW